MSEIIKGNCYKPDMLEKDYHADPCETPSLSSGMCKSMLITTEEQARLTSQRLNKHFKEKKNSPYDFWKDMSFVGFAG